MYPYLDLGTVWWIYWNGATGKILGFERENVLTVVVSRSFSLEATTADRV